MDWYLAAGDVAGVPRLRAHILDYLARQVGDDADLADAEVVVSELLSNALRHASGPAWIALRWEGENPTLSVSDLGTGFSPSAQESVRRGLAPRDPLAEGGRGLFLAHQLAKELQVVRSAEGGAVVTATLAIVREEPAVPEVHAHRDEPA